MSKPHINLLPYRQERRAQKQREFVVMTALAAIVGIIVVFFGDQVLSAQLENQNDRNSLLQTEITKLDSQIKEIDRIQKEIKLAIERKKTVESLQNNRTVAVHLLDEMIRDLPEGVYLRSSKQRGNQVTVNGYAQSKAHVSAFMRTIEASQWVENPRLHEVKLIELKDTTPGQKKDDARRPKTANEFTLVFTIRSTPIKPKTQTAGNASKGSA